jgi:hypothetical protein
MTYACPTREFVADTPLKITWLTKQGSPHHWKFSKVHTGQRFAHSFQPSVYDYIRKLCTKQAEVIKNHENDHVRNIGQGKARHRKYKGLKLDGSQAYNHSSDQATIVA